MTFFCARNRKKGCFRQFLSSQAKDSVWPVSSAFSRQRSDIRQCRRPSSPQPGQTEWCAPPGGGRGKDGRRRGSCRGRICSRRRPSFPFSFPMRCTIPQDAPASSGTPCSQESLLWAALYHSSQYQMLSGMMSLSGVMFPV